MLFFTVCSAAFPYGGIESGAKKLNLIKTTYFDIIYPPESNAAAQKIAAVCDSDYEEICSLLGTDAYQRFPVVVTHSVQSLNAYFASVPYNRIVVYDTLPSEELDSYDDTITSVFYHELTHAVTLNMKNGFWRFMSGVFADTLTPAYLTLTTFWDEGATVSFESRGAGGRLNNPFSTQIVAQAKLENRFPSWRDVTGARDTYPGGTDAYMFGAEFAKYLQNTYGMEKYGDFWRAAGSHLSPTFVSGVFKSAYNKKITDVWNEFRDSYKVPEVSFLDGGSASSSRDFFAEAEHAQVSKNGFSRKNNRKSVFKYLSSADNGIVWCDTKCSAVFYAPIIEKGNSDISKSKKDTVYGKSKKILTMTGVQGLSLSADGTKVTVDRLVQKGTVKSVVIVCELKNSGTEKCGVKKQYTIKSTGLTNSCVIENKTVAAVVSTSCPVQIALYTLAGGSAEKVPSKILTLGDNEIPFSLNDAGNGRLAFVCKKGLAWTVRMYSADFSSYDEIRLPDGIIVHNLHAVLREKTRTVFTFAWAQLRSYADTEAPMLPRAGTLEVLYDGGNAADVSSFAQNTVQNTVQGTVTLQQNDIIGGVTDAVGMRPSLVYTSSFYDTTRLCVMNGSIPVKHYDAPVSHVLCGIEPASDSVTVPETAASSASAPQISVSAQQISDGRSLSSPAGESSFSVFPYFLRGIFLPAGIVPVYSHDTSLGQTGTALLGATWITSDPWGNTVLLASAGYDAVSESGGALFEFVRQNDTASVSMMGTAVFDKKGFVQSAGNGSASYTIYAGNVSSISLSAAGFILYGRSFNGYTSESSDDEAESASYAGLSSSSGSRADVED